MDKTVNFLYIKTALADGVVTLDGRFSIREGGAVNQPLIGRILAGFKRIAV